MTTQIYEALTLLEKRQVGNKGPNVMRKQGRGS
jgi:hypothetical protein